MAPRAVILAAGRGSRLGPMTADRPKCLTVLGGMTLIGRQLATLSEVGITDIVVVAGYRAEMLDISGTRKVVNDDWQATNMVESLFAAEAEFGDDLIVAYGDIVYAPRVLAALLASRDDISVVVDRAWRPYWQRRFADPLSDAESLAIDGDGNIADIGGSATDIDAIEAQYIGLMRFRGAGIAALREAKATMGKTQRPWMQTRPPAQAYMTDLLMELILIGHAVHAVPVDGGWVEIDTAGDLRLAEEMIADASGDRFLGAPAPAAAEGRR